MKTMYTVAEARALKLPRLTFDDIRDLLQPVEVEQLEEANASALATYLGNWARVDEQACPFGHRYAEWAIVHGATRCTECGWPGRAYHYPKLLNDDAEVSFILGMFAHPSDCTDASTPGEGPEEGEL